MLTRNEIQHIAKLARLGLTPKEVARFQRELSSILDYFEKLKGVDISNVMPISHSIKVENVMREDIEKSKIKNQKSKINQKLLDLAPETKDGYLKVKSIF